MEKTKVLVIEDDASVRQVVCRILAEFGRYELTTAADGRKGAAALLGWRHITSLGLHSEFAEKGVHVDRALLLNEEHALALITRAEEEYVAIVRVDQISRSDFQLYERVRRRSLPDAERHASWRTARLFVEALSGRGLYFEVALEPPHATCWAKFLYLFRTGASWTSGARADDETIQ